MTIFALAAVFAAFAPALQEPQPQDTTVITLEQALEIALDENVSVKIADKEIQKSEYSRRSTQSALYPQIDASGTYQRTLKKQKMYVDGIPGMEDGKEVGQWNNMTAGFSLAMPIVNAQLWETLKISDQDVALSVEKARSSRLNMVTEVKNAYYAVLLAKEVCEVYKQVYQNAVINLEQTQKRYNSQKSSELDLVRAKTSVANAIPNVYDSQNSIIMALLQLKAVMGLPLELMIDVSGKIADYTDSMLRDIVEADTLSLEKNTSLRQLEIQSQQIASKIKADQYAYIPSLGLSFNYSFVGNSNQDQLSLYKWSPYSFVGLTLSIPIFSGGKRYSAIKQSKIQKAEIDLQKQDTERQLKIAIRQYIQTMEMNMKSYYSALDAQGSAQKAYDIAQKSYNVGRSTFTDLNSAQLALVQSQLSVTQAVYAFLVAKAGLEQTLGNDFE